MPNLTANDPLVAAHEPPAPFDGVPQGGRRGAPSPPLAPTIRPTIDRLNNGQPLRSPRLQVHAGWLGRGGWGTRTHTKTEPPRALPSRLRIIVARQEHTVERMSRKMVVSQCSTRASVNRAG